MADKQIKQLDEVTTIQNTDLFVVQKNSSDATNKVKAQNMIPDDSITSAKVSGIDKSNLTVDYNPYKFYAYRSTGWNWGNNAYTKVTFNTEIYDTNNNFDTTLGRYTVPVDGFYWFNSTISGDTISGAGLEVVLRKNGSTILSGTSGVPVGYTGTFDSRCHVIGLLQAVAGDYFEVFSYGANNTGSAASTTTYFMGFLVSRT